MFKVGIIGGENCESYVFFQTKCINILRNKAKQGEHIIIYTNGDNYVKKFSETFGIETFTTSCDWKRDGKDALKVFNENFLNSIDALILFDDGKANTNYLYNLATKKNLMIRKINL